MKTKPPFDGEIHAVSAKKMPDLNSPKREPGWFLGEPTPTRDEAVREAVRKLVKKGELVVYQVSDDRGLEEDEYVEVFQQIVAMLASAPAPASGRVDADFRPDLGAMKGGREPSLRAILKIYYGAHFSTAEAARLTEAYLASLSPAATPVSEAGGEVEQLKAYRDELLKIAADVGEPDDPFAAWEAIAALKALAKPASSPAGGDDLVAWIESLPREPTPALRAAYEAYKAAGFASAGRVGE